MLKVLFIDDTLVIEDREGHLISLTAYSGNHRTIYIHNITDASLDSLINALLRQEFKRKMKGK